MSEPASTTDRTAAFWVTVLCGAARRAPWLVRLMRPISIAVAWMAVPSLRENTTANARGLLGEGASERACVRIGRDVVASFHDFVFEVARLSDLSPAEARARVSGVEGRGRYDAARDAGRGVIVVTAHLGSFEVALAALTEVEPRLLVVFRRDEMAPFERARAAFRARLGVRECPVDDGLATWATLRDALGEGATVLVQGDRVVAGQPGTPARFGAGTLLVPSGPVKLARLTGAPLVPAASVRDSDGRVRILIGEAIGAPASAAEDAATIQRVSDALAGFVVRYPGQWLTLHRAFLEEPASRPPRPEEHPIS